MWKGLRTKTLVFRSLILLPKHSIAKALNTTTPDIINNAYRAKKIKPEKIHDNNTPVFMKKVINELRKLPEPKAERVCKSLITLLKEMNN